MSRGRFGAMFSRSNALLSVMLFALWSALNWLFNNLFYDWLLSFLKARFHVDDVSVITSVSSYVMPALIAALALYVAYHVGRRHAAERLPANGDAMGAYGEALAPASPRLYDPARELAIRAETEVSPIKVEVGETGDFFDTIKAGSFYTHQRILKIKVSNQDNSKSLIGCRVHLRSISNCEYTGPWILAAHFSIAAGDYVFIPLAAYVEPDNGQKPPYGETFMIIQTTKNQPKLDAENEHVIRLRVTAHDVKYKDFKCKLWVDETGRLRIHRAV